MFESPFLVNMCDVNWGPWSDQRVSGTPQQQKCSSSAAIRCEVVVFFPIWPICVAVNDD